VNRVRFNAWVFVLEGLHSFAATFYFNYLFFFFKTQFGFSNFENLLVCALNGFCYMPCSFYGGRIGQRFGYLKTIGVGCVIAVTALTVSAFARGVPLLLFAMVGWTVGICLTWPNIEALICEGEDAKRMPGLIGIYNIVWSAGGAFAYFLGGAIAEAAGWRSVFWIPALLHLCEVGMIAWLIPNWDAICQRFPAKASGGVHEAHPQGAMFLRMAWIANPFAYIAINATIPLIPDLAIRLQLSPKFAGFFCSIWYFARMFTFAFLAIWEGWHYRFRFLVAAYVGMLFCFAGMLLLDTLGLVIAIQIAFGWCLGLVYYSSLYYSMHVGESKGEHGGVHEAAIGAGIFAGPAIGATSLYFFPGVKHSGIAGVVVMLSVGLVALFAQREKRVTSSGSVAE
jgi:MFS family permease